MKKKTAVISISLLCVALVAVSAYAYSEMKKAESYARALEISHYHAFSELVTGMSELDTALQKSVYAKSPSVVSSICTEIFGKAMTTQMALGSLPFSTEELEKTAGFISQVGDYAYSISRSADSYTDENAEALKQLSASATMLAQNLQSLQKELAEGGMSMDTLLLAEAKMDEVEESLDPMTIGSGMRIIEGEFPEMPTLIYDGPFSEHLKDATPKLIENAELISEAKAQEIAAEFLAVDSEKLEIVGKSAGDIPSYYFSHDLVTIEVTEQGGEVLNFLSSYTPEKATMTTDEAITIAKTFLKNRGYADMKDSYFIVQNNICTINFAYTTGGVMHYPDLIKVSVALDRGNVVGFEARGYLSCHSERNLPEVLVSREEAQKLIGDDLNIVSYQLAVIPTAGMYELLCHEFVTATDDGGEFIFYINVESGQQEKILILLETENGSLTM